MRFKISLVKKTGARVFPVDYQYYIGAWIYKIVGKADRQLASFLHSSGYGEGNKKFKFFNYSPLDIRPYKLWKEEGLFELRGNEIYFYVSFHVDKVAENFVKGLFTDQNMFIGNDTTGVDFMVSGVEALPVPVFGETMHYTIKSPLVISIKEQNGKTTYLMPDDKRYANCFLNHLAEKYKGVLVSMPVNYGNNNEENGTIWTFKPSPPYRSGLRRIKPGTREETKVKGSIYKFELTALVEIHEMAYNCGFGEKNAMGFGWAEILKQ